jgi:hypothetical protein
MAYKIKKTKEKLGKEENYKVMGVRTSNAQDFVGSNIYPARYDLGLKEGEHYEVLAYSLWADTFVPTIVKWKTGEVDDFSDEKRTREIISKLP